MVGPGGLEPLTSSVSRKRSNQLSYGPLAFWGDTSEHKQLDPKFLIARKAQERSDAKDSLGAPRYGPAAL